MLPLSLAERPDKALRILALGSHADDIEIGCGGTILSLAKSRPNLEVHWVVLSADGGRGDEARRAAEAFLEGVSRSSIVVRDFRDAFFRYGPELKEFFEELKSEVTPDVVFTHYRDDLHQDHRLVCELTWNTFRNHLILEYEIPKYDGDLGSPNLFVPLEEDTCRRKVEAILDTFASQRGKAWFTEELFLSLLRIRGMEANSASGYAEGFYCRKAVLEAPRW
jgi:LmbE family N-acetylglucosaminyl deacetylase